MDSAWDTFIRTGHINDYLIYKGNKNALLGKDETCVQRNINEDTVIYKPNNTGVGYCDKYSGDCNP